MRTGPRLLALGAIVLASASCTWSDGPGPLPLGDRKGLGFDNQSQTELLLRVRGQDEVHWKRLAPGGLTEVKLPSSIGKDGCFTGLTVAVPGGPVVRRLPKTCNLGGATITADEVASVLAENRYGVSITNQSTVGVALAQPDLPGRQDLEVDPRETERFVLGDEAAACASNVEIRATVRRQLVRRPDQLCHGADVVVTDAEVDAAIAQG
jgi:hypothetical protein